MAIYIDKNNQQLGPFEEAQVLEMLKYGQLSPNDFAIRQGESQWKPLSTMFFVNSGNIASFTADQTQTSANQTGGSKMLLFGLLGAGSFILIAVVGLIGVFVFFGNKSVNSESLNKNGKNDKTAEQNPVNVKSNPKELNVKVLQKKAGELTALNPPLQPAANPIIKGKVAIVEKDQYGSEIIGFSHTGDKYSTDIEKYGIANVRLAVNPEEIETLIQIICTKGKYVGAYQGNVSGYASDCKVSIIDYKTPAIVAQQTFTNNFPPKSISSVYKDGGEYIFPVPNEVEEYIGNFPLDKSPASPADVKFDDDGGRYGKYKPFKDFSAELARVVYPVNINPSAAIKGKIAVALKQPNGRTELKGFDVYGKEIYTYDLERWGIGKPQLAEKPEEIDTLIQINCKKTDRIGTFRKTAVFANQCNVSVVDYKSSTIVFQKNFENKQMNSNIDTNVFPTQYVVLYPFSEIDEFIKSFPKT